ncbi:MULTISPECIES: LTA synthase family protein [Clostridia]|uniref:LTA synthase family protein n=1 Tax=Clostridia TaxID=186801 RepID=UPI000E5C94FD|nr:alkaline phosphatase family protein [Eubacterium sp. AF22-9]RGS32068.1 alkaline phosphatase family protein [Eubacterium sp. AF22-9]
MGKVKTFLQKIWTYDLVHTAVYSVILELVVECFNRRGIMGLAFPFMHPVIFIYNTLIIMTTMTIALFFTRRIFAYCVISIVWIGLSLTNFIILSSRKTPFTAMDFYLIKDAIKVAGLYVSIVQIILIALLVIAVITGLVFLWRKAPKIEVTIKKTKFYAYAGVQLVLVFLAVYGMGMTLLFTGTVESHYGNLAQAYKKYGFSHCFVSSVLDRGIKKSGEYSEEYMESLKKDLDDLEPEANDKTPNIIFVQLESFFDPTHVKGISLSENPLPNYQKLISEYSSGYLSVPCFGAGTCNTEFEVQTGINIDDFGPGEYPYRTIMKSKVCESMAYDLKKLGYSTHAIHNNDGTFYDRNLVFSHLGYDTFTSIEYMDGFEKTPMGWAKDYVLTDEIDKALNSTSGTDYVFTISVQGHGDYPSTPVEGYTPEINVTNFPVAEQQSAFEYYVNQIHEMDNFIGELIEKLSERDEETVLVLYGDHLPTFDFTDDMLSNGDKFQTQYVIWSNFQMDKQDKELQAYQLSAYVMNRLGISEGYIMKYHQSKQDLPEDEYLKNLKILEYDILYGKKEIYGGETPYEATDLKMGIDDIEITDVYNYNNDVFVEGNNFNDYSCVMINGKEYATEKISDRLLRVKGTKVKMDDVVVVAQKGDDKVELSRTTFTVKQQEKK